MYFWELLAQATEPDALRPVFDWLNFAANLGFAGLAWWLLAYSQPAMQSRFDNHSDKQLQAFLGESEKQRIAHEKTIDSIIRQHDAQQERLIRVMAGKHPPGT